MHLPAMLRQMPTPLRHADGTDLGIGEKSGRDDQQSPFGAHRNPFDA